MQITGDQDLYGATFDRAGIIVFLPARSEPVLVAQVAAGELLQTVVELMDRARETRVIGLNLDVQQGAKMTLVFGLGVEGMGGS